MKEVIQGSVGKEYPMTDNLRKLAEAASPGPWLIGKDEKCVLGPSTNDCIASPDVVCSPAYSDRYAHHDAANMSYIAAMHPQQCIAMLDEIEALRREVAELRGGFKAGIEAAVNWHDEMRRHYTIRSRDIDQYAANETAEDERRAAWHFVSISAIRAIPVPSKTQSAALDDLMEIDASLLIDPPHGGKGE